MRFLAFLLSITFLTAAVYFYQKHKPVDVVSSMDLQYAHFSKPAQTQIDCLTENIYFESAYEPVDGRVAVALVTLNRVQDPRYPTDICSVVKERKARVCQFSWYCEHGKVVRNLTAYNEAEKIAVHVYANYDNLKDLTHGALFYHADYVELRKIGVPNLVKTVQIGRHIFYKERGRI